jgi:hypothetical protein
MQEISDPSQSIDRARENWQKLGRSEKWIQQRMTGQETRNKLTDYWKESGIEKTDEFALLTNIIHQEWTGLTVKKHKELKGLQSQNLRDHMSEAELIFTALAELSTRQIAETDGAKGLPENAKASKKGGKIAKDARQQLELQTGKKVVTGENFLPPKKENQKLDSVYDHFHRFAYYILISRLTFLLKRYQTIPFSTFSNILLLFFFI